VNDGHTGERVPADPQRGRHANPEKTVRRLAYANRVLQRRVAQLERDRDEARQQLAAEHKAHARDVRHGRIDTA
jgi:uncharacterized protein YaiL (DUF2058 family)